MTDRNENGGSDLSLYDFSTQTPVLTVDAGNRLGFYGVPATGQPVVTGSWSDGSAARSLLQALVRLGLVVDQARP